MEKPVILIAEDNPSNSFLFETIITTNFPDVEVVKCENVEQCIDALTHYEGRIQAMLVDGTMEAEHDGFTFVRVVRSGNFGQVIQSVPVAVVSGGDVEFIGADPPVYELPKPVVGAQIAEWVREQVFEGPKRRAEADAAQGRLAEQLAQRSRDHNAQMLINSFQPESVTPGCSALDRSQQLMNNSEAHEFNASRIKTTRLYLNAAFENGNPSPALVERIVEALHNGHVYIGDDAVAMRFGNLKSEIRSKALPVHRDNSAKKLIELLNPMPADKDYDNRTQQLMDASEAHALNGDRLKLALKYLKGAFSAGEPSKPLVDKLRELTGGDDMNIADDSSAMRYRLLKSEINAQLHDAISVGRQPGSK